MAETRASTRREPVIKCPVWRTRLKSLKRTEFIKWTAIRASPGPAGEFRREFVRLPRNRFLCRRRKRSALLLIRLFIRSAVRVTIASQPDCVNEPVKTTRARIRKQRKNRRGFIREIDDSAVRRNAAVIYYDN